MGAWGPGLYQDDVTEDLKSSYVDRLHRGRQESRLHRRFYRNTGMR